MLYRLLENPFVHDLAQRILLLGRTGVIKSIERCINENCGGRVLDLGCGTKRYSHLFEDSYVGLDINPRYLKDDGHRKDKGRHFVCGDGTLLPFKDDRFDSVVIIGFFHHIDRAGTQEVFKELVRVSQRDAVIVMVDAFYPESRLDVVGHLLMKMDRGRYARRRDSFVKEVKEHFAISNMYHIKRSYPYNAYTFLLRNRKRT